MQHIYTGSIRGGQHQMIVDVIGKKGGSKTKRKKTYSLTKGVGPKLVEISLGSGNSAIEIKDQ